MINKDEMLFVVDEKNNPIQPRPRKEVHKHGYWHRTAHIWIVNDAGQILVQKRSMFKDSSPGKWEPFFGGHLEPDIEYVDGAIRELKEELGLTVEKDELEFFKVHKKARSHEFQGVFIYRWNGDIHSLQFEKEEIDHIEWVDPAELKEYICVNRDTHWTNMGYEKEILEHLASNK